MRRAFIYATFDGFCTNYHGIGTQTQSFLRHVAAQPEPARDLLGDIVLSYPDPRPDVVGYEIDHDFLAANEKVAAESGVITWPLKFGNRVLWRAATWSVLCQSLAKRIAEIADEYDQIIVIAVDAVFTMIAKHLDAILGENGWPHVRVVHALYSSGRIRGMSPVDGPVELQLRIDGEQYCVDRADTDAKVAVADVDDFFTEHLRDQYGLTGRALRFKQSLSLTSPDFAEVTTDERLEQLHEYRVPTDLPIVLYAGRTDPVKGLDLLIEALKQVRRNFRLVAIAVPYHPNDPALERIKNLLGEVNYPHVLVPHHTRPLLRALASSEVCEVVVCPSRGEPIGTLPQEVSLWARNGGPVIAASDCDGYARQIDHGDNGLLFPPGDLEVMARQVERALDMASTDEHGLMRRRAYQRVMAERDFGRNLQALLDDLALGDTEGSSWVSE